MPFLSRLATVAFVVAIPTLLVTTNIRFLASEARFYDYGLHQYNADKVTGIAMADLERAAREIIAYFENDAGTLRIIVTEDGQEVSLFDARETEHMRDVKKLMQRVYRLNEVSLAIVLGYITCVFLWSGEKPLRKLATESLLGVGVGFAGIVAIGVLALSGFDSAWTQFHEIAFHNDLWQLDPDTDHLIQMFPEPFWEDATLIVAGLTIAEALVVVIASLGYLLTTRAPSAQQPPRVERSAADARTVP